VPFNGYGLAGDSYAYDKANRLTGTDFGYYTTSWQPTSAYDASFSYDSSGNIKTLTRMNDVGNFYCDMTYHYITNTNRLDSISGPNSVTYAYDNNGNVESDTYRGIGFILYDPDNMPDAMYLSNGTDLYYENDVYNYRVRNTIVNNSDNFYFSAGG